jgi:hypothetical protein
VEVEVEVYLVFQNLVPAWEYGDDVTTTSKYYVVIGKEVGTVVEVLPPARLSSQLLLVEEM